MNRTSSRLQSSDFTTDPALTTVHQSPEEMGREMVALLLETIATPEAPHPGRMLPTRLVVRDSA